MLRFVFVLQLFTLGYLHVQSQTTSLSNLRTEINRLIESQKGSFAVAFKDLSTGETMLINEKEMFHAASTMKTPVMIEIFRQQALGLIKLSDDIVIKNEFKSIVDGSSYSLDSTDDSEKELYKQIGQRKTIADLVYDMIIKSSNLATNIIIELADAKKVTATMRVLGANDIQVLRGVEDGKAYQKGLNNMVTSYDLLLLFEKIAKGEAVNKESSAGMIKILLDQRFNDIIPARLPANVKVAHKTGWITGVKHDSGIVMLPDGRMYVLVLLSKKLEDEKAAVDMMSTISFMIYQYVSKT